MEDDCQIKDEKHAGQPVVKLGRGRFDFIYASTSCQEGQKILRISGHSIGRIT